MKHRALAAALVACALAAAAPPAHATPGTAAQEFTLPAAPGHTFRGRFRLNDHLNRRPVVILFWATWCQPCLQELPIYQALFQQYGGRLMVVGISMDGPDTVSEAGATARRLGITFPIVTDLETQVVSVYNTRRAAPFSVWINRDGIIDREREGFAMSEVPNIQQGVARLVGARPPA
ncbi:MAG: TlpA disulfide reductase family protein, partial [Polyangiales bacterium]